MSTHSPAFANVPIRIGVSACLLGTPVRYDGGHAKDQFVTSLEKHFEWAPICPEAELGLGTPRETIHLVQATDEVRLQTTKTNVDLTDRMRVFSSERVAQLASELLSGFILKSKSPSCGPERVKILQPDGEVKRTGQGLFAKMLVHRFPHLPVIDEAGLGHMALRDNWLARVFAYCALQALWQSRWNVADLVTFHTRYKYLLLAHSEPEYRQLGQLVAGAKGTPRSTLCESYTKLFMGAMHKPSTPRKNVNVLQHMLGFFKRDLDSQARLELITAIEDYSQHRIPLIVPLKLIQHQACEFNIRFLQQQVYLNPHPSELALRHHG